MSWFTDFLGKFKHEPTPATGDPARIAEVQTVLDELAPAIAADGGRIDLLSVEDGWVSVRLQGACSRCMISDTTVHDAIEPRLRERYAWVRGVRAR